MRCSDSRAMHRLTTLGAGAILLVSIAQAGRSPSSLFRNPGSATDDRATAVSSAAVSSYSPGSAPLSDSSPRTWEAAVFGAGRARPSSTANTEAALLLYEQQYDENRQRSVTIAAGTGTAQPSADGPHLRDEAREPLPKKRWGGAWTTSLANCRGGAIGGRGSKGVLERGRGAGRGGRSRGGRAQPQGRRTQGGSARRGGWEDDEDEDSEDGGMFGDDSEEFGSRFDSGFDEGFSEERETPARKRAGTPRRQPRSSPGGGKRRAVLDEDDEDEDDLFSDDDDDRDEFFGGLKDSDDEDDYYGEDDDGFTSEMDDDEGYGYDYDSEEDDGYGNDRRRSGGGRGRGARGRGGAKGMGGRKGRGGARGRKPKPAAMQRFRDRLVGAQAGLKTKMSGVTHKGAKVIRELKGSVSSDLEKTLIKATRPDNDPAKRKHVNLLLQAAEQAFPVYMDPEDRSLAAWKEGPYWMTLHKLWRRMAEKDYRTATKAVYVLHRLARGTTTESWEYFRMTLQEMRREDDKGTKSAYFSRRVIRNVDRDGEPYSDWMDSYADFVLLRLQSFAPDMSELASVDAETSHQEVSRSLQKAERLIEAALACELGPDLDNDITTDCLKLVVEDLCELWSLFQQTLEIRLQQRFAEGGLSRTELRRTLGFLEFYLEHVSRSRDLVRESHRLLALYNQAVPRSLGDALATDMLQEQVAWIQEELTEKAKALVGKSATDEGKTRAGRGSGGAGRRSSPSAPKEDSKVQANSARKPRAIAAANTVATKPTPSQPKTAPETAEQSIVTPTTNSKRRRRNPSPSASAAPSGRASTPEYSPTHTPAPSAVSSPAPASTRARGRGRGGAPARAPTRASAPARAPAPAQTRPDAHGDDGKVASGSASLSAPSGATTGASRGGGDRGGRGRSGASGGVSNRRRPAGGGEKVSGAGGGGNGVGSGPSGKRGRKRGTPGSAGGAGASATSPSSKASRREL